jgi:sialate O-acetylesterase
VKSNLKASAPGPFELSIQGKNQIVLKDLLVGGVWLASGQSNMELPLGVTEDADAESAQSADASLRQFAVARKGANQPLEDCDGVWTVASPATSGDFTSVSFLDFER